MTIQIIIKIKYLYQAGRVTYTGENFLEKNRDSLPLRVSELFKSSQNELLREIFDSSITYCNLFIHFAN